MKEEEEEEREIDRDRYRGVTILIDEKEGDLVSSWRLRVLMNVSALA